MNIVPKEIALFFETDTKNVLKGYFIYLSELERDKYARICSKYKKWESGVPFAISVFGEVLEWSDDGYIILYKIMEDSVDVILQGSDYFAQIISDSGIQSEYLEMDKYTSALNQVGELEENECYIFEPIPALGGSKDVNTISKGDRETYLSWMVQML